MDDVQMIITEEEGSRILESFREVLNYLSEELKEYEDLLETEFAVKHIGSRIIDCWMLLAMCESKVWGE